MSLSPSPDDAELLALVDEYEALLRSGAAPSPNEFASRYPGREAELMQLLPAMAAMVDVAPRAAPERIGPFRVVRELGRGGMGVVYLAEDPSLGRRVALKVLPPAWGADSSTRERFTREAQAAAKLEHPHLVPVFGVGADEGLLWYAMAYIDGAPLDVLLDGVRDAPRAPSSRRPTDAFAEEVARLRDRTAERPRAAPNVAESARIVLEVASALAHAHERGVVHRDVKPSNVLIDADGRARVADFGLCRVDDGASLTQSGDLVGTLRYMSPEQLEGVADERSDVYAAGLVLHELLAREPAFASTARGDLIDAIRNRGPRRLRRVDPSIPRDLENVVLRATAREPEQRYPTARALVRDLEAFLDGRPVSAQPPSFAYLARLFVDRHRAAVLASFVVLALLVSFATWIVASSQREARVQEVRSYRAELAAAEAALRSGDTGLARAALARAPSRLRGWEWRHLSARASAGETFRMLDCAPVERVVVVRPGLVVAVGESASALFDVESSRSEVVALPAAHDAAFLERTGELALVRRDGRVQVGVPGEAPRTESERSRGVERVAFDPAGKVWFGFTSGSLGRWQTGDPLGWRLFTGGRSRPVEVRAGAETREVRAWFADGTFLEMRLETDGQAKLEVVGSWRAREIAHVVTAVAESPAHDLTVMAGSEGELSVRRTSTGELVRVLSSDGGAVSAIAIDERAERVVAGGRDGRVHLHDLGNPSGSFMLGRLDEPVAGVLFCASGAAVTAISEGGDVVRWPATVRGGLVELRGHLLPVSDAALSEDGAHVVTVGEDRLVLVFNALSGCLVDARSPRELGATPWTVRVDSEASEARVADSEGGVVAIQVPWAEADSSIREPAREARIGAGGLVELRESPSDDEPALGLVVEGVTPRAVSAAAGRVLVAGSGSGVVLLDTVTAQERFAASAAPGPARPDPASVLYDALLPRAIDHADRSGPPRLDPELVRDLDRALPRDGRFQFLFALDQIRRGSYSSARARLRGLNAQAMDQDVGVAAEDLAAATAFVDTTSGRPASAIPWLARAAGSDLQALAVRRTSQRIAERIGRRPWALVAEVVATSASTLLAP